MPELPEVETIVRGLQKSVLDRPIREVQILHQAIVVGGKLNLSGDKIKKIERHGKYIKITLRSGQRLLVHLRMTGQLFLVDQAYRPDKHVHLIISFNNKARLIYRDIRKFGRWQIIPDKKNFEDYINAGVDALAITRTELQELMLRKPETKLKAFLLDQPLIAGIGNIYADEICHLLKVDPETKVKRIDTAELFAGIGKVLRLAIKNKGTSVSDYITSAGARGNFQNLLSVYKQKSCRSCRTVIKRKKVAGRTSHYCPSCQKK